MARGSDVSSFTNAIELRRCARRDLNIPPLKKVSPPAPRDKSVLKPVSGTWDRALFWLRTWLPNICKRTGSSAACQAAVVQHNIASPCLSAVLLGSNFYLICLYLCPIARKWRSDKKAYLCFDTVMYPFHSGIYSTPELVAFPLAQSPWHKIKLPWALIAKLYRNSMLLSDFVEIYKATIRVFHASVWTRSFSLLELDCGCWFALSCACALP